jgi:TPR repeat protein
MYSLGQGTPQSDTNAFTCYEIAAEGGDSSAKYMLGNWLLEGKGCEKKNIPRGIALLVR